MARVSDDDDHRNYYDDDDDSGSDYDIENDNSDGDCGILLVLLGTVVVIIIISFIELNLSSSNLPQPVEGGDRGTVQESKSSMSSLARKSKAATNSTFSAFFPRCHDILCLPPGYYSDGPEHLANQHHPCVKGEGNDNKLGVG